MPRCRVLVAIVIGVAGPAFVRASNPISAITVRVHDTARLGTFVVAPAVDVAGRTLRGAMIDVTWLRCDSDGTSAPPVSCHVPPRPHEYVVRLLRSTGTTTPDRWVLGHALVDVGGSAVLATVYADQVQRLADLTEVDAATLVGRAMAHEIGHLLLATNTHSERGLMRAEWNSRDVRRNDAKDWMFTERETAAMRARLARMARDSISLPLSLPPPGRH